MKVAVVDSGIAPNHPHVVETAAGISFVSGVTDTLDRIGHGTAVAAAIREKAPNAELVPVKVFDRALKTDARALADAIRWAAEQECRLINLSLGTANTDHNELLSAAVTFAGDRGALVVSAFESDGNRWLPGSMTGVVPVIGDDTPNRDRLIVDARDGQFRFHASIYPRPIPGVPPERNLHGISFAVANVTGMLCRYLERESGYLPVAEIAARLSGPSTSPTSA